ncbi:hypothetical protein PG984_012859 [Apiospora sp. TS-2023a]
MRLLGPDRLQWELFVALYPLFKRALPSKELPAEIRGSLSIRNDVGLIRQSIRAISHVLPNVDLSCNLEDSKYSKLLKALDSLLEVFESIVEEDVRQPDTPVEEDAQQSHDKESENRLQKSQSLDATLIELAEHIDYIGIDKPRKYNSRHVADEIRKSKLMIDDIFIDPLEALEKNLGNASQLSTPEIGFLRRASCVKSLSKTFFTFAKSFTSSTAHKTRLHLSGFTDHDIKFELLITHYEKEHWKLANCRLAHSSKPSGCNRITHGFDAQSQLKRAESETIHIAFNSEDMWYDEDHTLDTVHDTDLVSFHTIHDLLRPVSNHDNDDDDDSNSEPEVQKFVEEDQKIVELLVASSLLKLNASAWLGVELSINNVFLVPTSALHLRWKPHVTCSLESADCKEDTHDAILSFGLFLMEMEKKQAVRPKAADKDWETGRFSKDSMLKRIIKEWSRSVGDGYRDVAMACLRFRELSARFHDGGLSRDMYEIAAFYKYILAPLHRINIRQYSNISSMFGDFPDFLARPNVQSNPRPQLCLFDGSEKHDSTDTERFLEMISQLSSNSPVPALADSWRKEKIRIAIIDTGIDDECDDIIAGCRESSRIKRCCGFVNGVDAKPDYDDYKDINGHGTHVARFMLNYAPAAQLYIAKISNEATIQPLDLHRITRAIKWAHEEMQVNIISISFGLNIDQHKDIDRAIWAAFKDNITIFAAASNSGGNKPRAYPSNRERGVICVHASDGLGNDGRISPTPLPDTDNFSTLGISVSSKWKGDDVLKSGTSFATPIAAALAADMLEFARHKCELDKEEYERLCEYGGICQILRLMAGKRQGYHYITPLSLWDNRDQDDMIRDMIRNIHKIASR